MKISKNTLKIIAAVVVAVAIIVVTVVVVKNNKDAKNKPMKEELTLESVEISTDDPNRDPWDDVSVIQETTGDGYIKDEKGNPVTDEKGEKVTASYPGEDDGWSPMVPAGEVNQQ